MLFDLTAELGRKLDEEQFASRERDDDAHPVITRDVRRLVSMAAERTLQVGELGVNLREEPVVPLD